MRDRKQFLVAQGDEDVRRHAVAPLGRSFRLLVDGQPLGEPARHAVVGGGEDVDVAHLMPERAAPIKVAGLAARGAVHGDDLAKGHAQGAEAGHSHGANREVLVVGVDFHLHGARKLHLVFLLVRGHAAFQLRFKIGAQQLGFLLVQFQDRGLISEGNISSCSYPAGEGC